MEDCKHKPESCILVVS